jgi:hypothetical protein
MLVMVNYHWFPSDLDMVVKGNYHWFPSDFVTWLCWLWLIIIDFPQTLSLGHIGYGTIVGKLSLISLRLYHLVMLVMVNYHWFPSDFVTWLCWLWEIITDFPQTLSRGYVGYGKLSLIFLWICHVVMLVMVNYHWFPSDFVTWLLVMGNYLWFSSEFVTWSCWLWEIIIDFPQTLSLDYWFPSDFVTWSSWLWLIIIDFPQTLSRGHVG